MNFLGAFVIFLVWFVPALWSGWIFDKSGDYYTSALVFSIFLISVLFVVATVRSSIEMTQSLKTQELIAELKRISPLNPTVIKLKQEAGQALDEGNVNRASELIKETYIQYLSDALDIIDRNCKSFYEGHYPDYRVVANQLKILLTDQEGGKDNSLTLKVFPNLKLHPMRIRIEKDPKGRYPLVKFPFALTGIPKQAKTINIFDTSAEYIFLEVWREQIGVILQGKAFLIEDIINSVADKGGGSHVADEPDEYLTLASRWYHKGADRRATGQHEPMIAGIGEYIVSELRNQLSKLEKKNPISRKDQ